MRKNKFTISQVRHFWDSVGRNYDRYHERGGIHETHFRRFSVSMQYLDLKAGDKVLNVWSRTGEAIPYLRQKQAEILLYNLEASNEFVKVAQARFPGEKFDQTDLEKLPFSDNFFNAILSLETLEHVPHPLLFMSELYRVLRPEGQLVMSVPTSTMEWPMRIYQILVPDHGEGPHRFLFPTSVKKLITDTGFELRLHRGTLLLPAGPTLLRNAADRLMELFQNTFLKNFGLRQFYICRKS